MASFKTALEINSGRINCWNATLTRIIEGKLDESALQKLILGLEQLVDGESGSIIVYPPNQRPYVACHRLLPEEDPSIHIDQYLAGAYLVDPCYLFARQDDSEGFRTTKDVAPQGFESSEYFNIYYQEVDLQDEAFYALKTQNDDVVLVSVGRHSHASDFEKEEKQLLEGLFPVVKAIVCRCLEEQPLSQAANGMERELDLALAHFGSSLLTPREATIVNYLLRGHSVKSIAEVLSNSVETIKHHRKNIYLKLDVTSQAELFHLFIDSLRGYVPEEDKDPLTAYMSL